MKVIGAKSLVEIMPSVVSVGDRASPNVFEYDHQVAPEISCEGATNSILFAENPDFTSWLSIDSITINGVEYAKPEGLPSGDLVPEVITPSGDQISVSIGGVHPNRTLMFENVGTRPARISIKVLNGIEYSPNIIEQGLSSTNTNPTAIFDSDNYVINFCLSSAM